MWDSLYTNLYPKAFLASIMKLYMHAHTWGMRAHALYIRKHT